MLAVEDGGRQSEDPWAAVFYDLHDRGMNEPKLTSGDGGIGAWAVLRSVFPGAREQHCWVHKTANVLDALPKDWDALTTFFDFPPSTGGTSARHTRSRAASRP